jgi:hypothetical protein
MRMQAEQSKQQATNPHTHDERGLDSSRLETFDGQPMHQQLVPNLFQSNALTAQRKSLGAAFGAYAPIQCKVAPTTAVNGHAVNDDPRLEREADRMGAHAMRIGSQNPQPGSNNKSGLPSQLKSGIEQLSGHNLDNVRVQYNSEKPAQLNALAYTQGTEIHVAPGQEKHLPHEAWHVVQQTRASEPVAQLQSIKSAGLELEWKGASVEKDGADPKFAKHEHLFDGAGWYLEVDAGNPEVVTDAFESKAALFERLHNGILKLIEIWDYAKLRTIYEAAADGTPAKEEATRVYGEKFLSLNLLASAHAEETGRGGAAKPQLTLGLKKTGLKEFVENATSTEKIRYEASKGALAGAAYGRVDADRINAETRTAYIAWKKYLTDHVPVLAAEIEAADGKVAGLVLVSVLESLFATRLPASSADSQQYYKSRFSILPRIALSALYDELSADEKLSAKDLLTKVAAKWTEAGQPLTMRDWTYEYKYDPTYTEYAKVEYSVKDQLTSVFDDTKRSEKTFARHGNEKKNVDLISSDMLASTSEIGESVGAYRPDKQAPLKELSGLFELRSMPYVSIDNEDSVKAVFEKTLASYGDMP